MNTVVYHGLNPPIGARYIRVVPVDWHYWISMRIELYGCQGNEGVFLSAIIPVLFALNSTAILVIRVISTDDINVPARDILASLTLGSITGRCSGKEPALLPRKEPWNSCMADSRRKSRAYFDVNVCN